MQFALFRFTSFTHSTFWSIAMRKLMAALFIFFVLNSSLSAVERELIAIPTGWRLQNLLASDGVCVFHTGHSASCGGPYQVLCLPADVTNGNKNRFWAAIAQGKALSKQIFVYYEDTTCAITSFGLHNE